MNNQQLGAIAIAAGAAAVGLAVYSVRSDSDYCPPPSAGSVAALFAPCQAFADANGRSLPKSDAVLMGLLTPERRAAPRTQLADGELPGR